MPVPKSLRGALRPKPPKRTGPCPLCNSLSPLNHAHTSYASESKKQMHKTLTLALDGLALQKSKCNHCKLLCDALDAFFKTWRSSRGRIVVDLGEKRPVVVRWNGGESEGLYLEVYAGADTRPAWPTLGAAHPIPSNSGSDDTLAFARRCISDCLTSPTHTLCRHPASSTTTPIFPARLLDVGRVNAPIKLVKPSRTATPESLPYATLSHCWGPNPLLSTTSTNLTAFGRAISWEALPPLFRDAVTLTRQLGLRYIWIDSLCIIQDSVADWEAESVKMGAIYQASHVTLAAIECGDSNTAIFKERSRADSRETKISYTDGHGKDKEVRVRKMLDQHPERGVGNGKGKVLPKGPLAERAWALQEHVLAARVLLFTQSEVLFECRTGWRCECSPGDKKAGMAGTTPGMIPKALAALDCSGSKTCSRKVGKTERTKSTCTGYGKLWSTWHTLVASYSTRALTHPRDKLPALSGLASQIVTATSSPYLAGLWLDNLAHDLLWSSHPSLAPPHLAHRLDSCRAPSFSWASVDTQVLYYEPDKSEGEELKSNIEVVDWCIDVKGENPLGEVTGGHILLKGQVVEGILVANKDGETRYSVLIKGSSSLSMAPDSLIVEDDIECSNDSKGPGEVTSTVRRARPGEKRADLRAKVLCMNIAGFGREWVSGLVLGLSASLPGAYERVGVFESGSEVFAGTQRREVRLV